MVKSEVAKLRIACGRHHSAFVSSENDLYTWGKASCGRYISVSVIKRKSVSCVQCVLRFMDFFRNIFIQY